VWEKLADVSGDNAFCNSNFSVYNPKSSPSKTPMSGSAGGASKESISLEQVQNVCSPTRARARGMPAAHASGACQRRTCARCACAPAAACSVHEEVHPG